MISTTSAFRVLACLACGVALAACGGSKGSSDDPGDPAATVTTAPRSDSDGGSSATWGMLPDSSSIPTDPEHSSSTSQASDGSSTPPVSYDAGDPCRLLSTDAVSAVAGVPITATSQNVEAFVAGEYPACVYSSPDNPTFNLTVVIYPGRDPVELLAQAENLVQNGTKVAGLGVDNYLATVLQSSNGDTLLLLIDTGREAISLTATLGQQPLEQFGRTAIANL